MKWILLLFSVGVVLAAHEFPAERTRDDIVCAPNSIFKRDCNTCFCSASGRTYGCTKMACLDFDEYDRPQYDTNELPTYRKREVKLQNFRKKRAADNIYAEDDQQFFIDENPAPRSYEQQQELARQSYMQQQQSYYDQLQLQQDLAREKEELEQQQEDMQEQLEYQQEQDAQQREEDARQLAIERQQMLLEQQQQRKQDDQYLRKVRNFPRKNAFKNMYSQ